MAPRRVQTLRPSLPHNKPSEAGKTRLMDRHGTQLVEAHRAKLLNQGISGRERGVNSS